MMQFTTKQWEVLRAVCDAFIPPVHCTDDADGYWRRSAQDMNIAEKIAEAVDFVSPVEQAEFRQLLDLLASPLVGLSWLGALKSAQNLTPQQREQLLQSWAQSRIGVLRKGFSALRKLTTFLYYGFSDETPENRTNPNWKSIGYPGPLSEPPALERPIRPSVASDGAVITCDVLVIGSGAGGGVVAGELAEAGLSVIVIEKGSYVAEDEMTQRETEMMTKLYEAAGTLTTRDGGVSVLAGSCLGGGTTVNWSAALRTPDYVLDAWARNHDNPHFLTAEYRAGFNAVERATHVDRDESAHNAQNQALHDGAVKLGWDIGVIPRNANGCTVDDCKMCGYCSLGCQRGTKQSTVKTYLQTAYNLGTRIFVNAEAEHILVERGQAVGARIVQRIPSRESGEKNLRENKEWTVRAGIVVAAAGSIHTPALLMRSGLQHPHIGRHLNFHPTVAMAARYKQEMNPWWGNMMTALSNQVAELDGGYGAKIETPPVHSGLLAMALPWVSGKQHKETMLNAKHLGAFVVLTRDRDGGRVSVDKRGRPVIDYAISRYDLSHLLKGVEAAAQLHLAAGAEELFFPHNSFKMFKAADGAEALKKLTAQMPRWGWRANQFPLFTAHQMASCRMGGTRAEHPVAPNGETYEVKNLYVADASAFPECSGANPMLSVQTLAHYIAQGIKATVSVVGQ